MIFSVFGLLAIGTGRPSTLLLLIIGTPFKHVICVGGLLLWSISCNTWAVDVTSERAGWTRIHARWQFMARAGVELPPKRSMIIFGATTPKLIARIIAIAVMA